MLGRGSKMIARGSDPMYCQIMSSKVSSDRSGLVWVGWLMKSLMYRRNGGQVRDWIDVSM
jgi:hypothetical protein